MNTITLKQIKGVETNTLERIPAIRQSVGNNWFPCGNCWLTVKGNSEIVRFFKKHGEALTNDRYAIGMVEVWKQYDGGYAISFRYLGNTATEQQSLNFREPLYRELQKQLKSVGIEAGLYSYVD